MAVLHTHSPFRRKFFTSGERFMVIGSGSLGGKAEGLGFFHNVLASDFDGRRFSRFDVSIPTLSVIASDVFDAFIERNSLEKVASSHQSDDHIALAFQQGDLPVEILGDLRSLVMEVHTPLAIRSSSMLEDSLNEPFAGIYETKMIPNNQHDPDVRFRKLTEAIKLVYASTFFKAAKDYRRAIGRGDLEEKMSVVIQEVVGNRFNDRFYPAVSGVARSFNFYPTGKAKPEDGVVNLALGLGKTIVDGGVCWNYSPHYPKATPPYGSLKEWLTQTQTMFWAVNMGKPAAYDPIRETEYLVQAELSEAEADETLKFVASTYSVDRDRITVGTSANGARIITFAPVLVLNEPPLNDLIRTILSICERTLEAPVEIEFAVTFDPLRFGCLQVRPMVVSQEVIALRDDELSGDGVLAASERVMGNGVLNSLRDVVYVRPEGFESKKTPAIASELEAMNRELLDRGRPYLLIGFGRWGSSDSWLGIPVNWGQVSGARAIVEATLPSMDVEMSQGSHFFHNITSFRVPYFAVHHADKYAIDWEWLDTLPAARETPLIRHVELPSPLSVKVDGRSGRGVILKRSEKDRIDRHSPANHE